jgi:8-amino-7-oxononanoate synthase
MNNRPMDDRLAQSLEQRVASHSLRKLTLDRAPVDFYSNDYLGIATCGLPSPYGDGPKEVQRPGSSGSRLLSGNYKAIEELEEYAAGFHNTEAALVFNSGYDANLGLLACIASKKSCILYDELCHASILDGIRLSYAGTKLKFAHNDLNDLEKKLQRLIDTPVIIVAESVYSMDGDWAPLQDLAQLASRHDAMLIIDEAHATGVWGDHGKGLVQHLKLEKEVYARIHTFGKAMGGHGAAIVGSHILNQYLTNFARSFIYTTALPPHTVNFARQVYEYFSSDSFSNKSLHDLIIHFNRRMEKNPLRGWKKNCSAIQSVVIGDPLKAKSAAAAAVKSGMQVNAIVHPSVAKGTERLRICLHSFNTSGQVDDLIQILEERV